MIGDAAALLGVAQEVLWAGVAVFLRVAAMAGVFPVFGEQSVPLRLRLAIALALTLVVLPAVPLAGGAPGLAALVGEPLVGLFFGLFLRLIVMALQIAGTIAAQSTSLSQIFGASAGIEPLPAMGHFLVVAGLALAALLDLHVRAAAYILLTYELAPVSTVPAAALVAEVGVAEVGRAFRFGFALAAPFLVASLLYNITLGVINRAMPQLMVAFVGAPAITAGGLALLAISAPIMLAAWSDRLLDFLAAPFGALP
ncbi:flagellar biosynthetic protein FliR [Oceanicola granulosus HTCC2516]|uniref:Flagellar biosynthetic protein FliR n=1 Tax=Oceanicola granulosus (strain ATCC BAA-861 / DSM 15982 / KCTC 12143 / HTCC2516) TaxID=314256 RepID=Q2CDI2_OCEGH|nr:flagellar biosynthetic protein FliR [Oceanicola granulosus]EAR50729.1 flagellar biosynthetic protein FliR [Oceanicola granulosus HTCC2516]